MKVLELFAGTRSIGKAFEKRGHEVFSVEWDKQFDHIDLYEDILKVQADDIIREFGKPDVIWASPDCSSYSIAAISHHRERERETAISRQFLTMRNSVIKSISTFCALFLLYLLNTGLLKIQEEVCGK